jgi:thioredoxin
MTTTLDAITSPALLEESANHALTIVDFQADWCGPCQTMIPIVANLEAEFSAVHFVAVDIDKNPTVASDFSVQSIPTFLFLRDGEVLDRFVGAMPEATLRARIQAHVPATV